MESAVAFQANGLGSSLLTFRPRSPNRSRHDFTVAGETPTRSAIRVLATPSAANSKTFACYTSRCGAVRDLLTPLQDLTLSIGLRHRRGRWSHNPSVQVA